MSLDPTTFQTIVPSRYITFTLPSPLPAPFLHTPLLRISVLDSPSTTTTTIKIAAMLVPPKREHDWTFSTETGHLQLLLSFPHLSRLILIANNITTHDCPQPSSYKPPLSTADESLSQIEENLVPLLLALTPKSTFGRTNGLPEIPFLSYEDGVISSVVLEICVGACVGEMLIENVELELGSDNGREFRRRLRFKRMPNLVQTQVRIHPVIELDGVDGLDGVEFRVDHEVLVQPYLGPMVAGLVVVSSYLEERIRDGFRPKALCLGVGGGALVNCLSDELGFEVVGVEEDEVVLSVGKKYFGLKESEFVHLCVGDGIELIQKLALKVKVHDPEVSNGCNSKNACCLNYMDGKFDVIMVDLDSSDARMGSSAPPLEFVRKSVLLAAREIICQHGVLIINVIPTSKSVYEILISEFQDVFEELYEIDVGNGENVVVVASALKIGSACGDYENSILRKLKVTHSCLRKMIPTRQRVLDKKDKELLLIVFDQTVQKDS